MNIWSWILGAVSVCTVYIALHGKWYAWAVGWFAQALWAIYAILTNQYGFLVSCIAFVAVYYTGFRKWRADGRTTKA